MIRPLSILLTLTLTLAVTVNVAGAAIETQADMDAVVKQLTADADKWVQGQAADSGAESKLPIMPDEKYIPMLSVAMGQLGKDPVNLYVGNRLIRPLLSCNDTVIRKALPVVVKFYEAAGTYQQFPKLSPDELKLLQASDKAPTTDPAAEKPPSPAAQKARQAKIAHERPIMLHDQELYTLEVMTAKLMLFANTPETDKALLEMLKKLEGDGIWSYVDIINIIRTEAENAKRMPPERAKIYYEAVLKLSNDLRLKKKSYIKPQDIKLSAGEQTVIPSVVDYTGIRLTEALNVLSPRAQMPAMNVPTKQEVDGRGGRPRRGVRGEQPQDPTRPMPAPK